MALPNNQIQQPVEPTNNYGEDMNNNSCFWKRPREDTDERSFNFNIKPEDMEFHRSRKTSKQQRDPMSHRIIEKRRRDRMNNCLSDLSKLIPHGYIKQGQGRIEKTEIVEMAIKHITSLQMQVKQVENKGLPAPSMELKESFHHGFQTCKSEIIKFLTEIEGVSQNNPFNIRLCEHLNMRKTQIFDEEMSKYRDFHHPHGLPDVKQSPLPEIKITPNPDSVKPQSLPEEEDDREKSPGSVSSDYGIFPQMKISNNVAMKRIMSGLDSYSDSGVSIQTSTNGSTTGNQTSSDDSTEEQQNGGKSCYKFKHIIRHRYSRDKGSDSSSVSSGSSDGRPCRSHKNNSSNNTNNGGQSCVQSSNMRMDENESIGLPGFVIHPTHTHYVPISVHQSFLPDLFETESNNYGNQKVFHPISIPVHFSSAYALKAPC